MRLKVLQSGSSGNGYILYNDREALILECGVGYDTCLKEMKFKRGLIVGALVTHEHGDHAKYVEKYLEAAIPVYMSSGTASKLEFKTKRRPAILTKNKVFRVGNFLVLAFDTKHDSEEPVGFLIRHPEMGQIVFATDTYYLPYKFECLSHIMIECNYDNHIIDRNVEEGKVPYFVRDRVNESHMSLETCIETLKANDLSNVNNIVLLHLSSKNSNPEFFKREVENETGKIVTIAKKGVDIPFNKEMF